MAEEISDREIHKQPYLNGQHLNYVLHEAFPSDVDFNDDEIDDDDETVQQKADEIHNRLNALIEDLVLLQKSELVTKEQWEEMWECLNDSESAHAFCSSHSFNQWEASYELGLRLGHLANLLAYPARQPSADIRYVQKRKRAIQAGFALGANRYGLRDAEHNESELAPDLQDFEHMTFDMRRTPEGASLDSIGEVEQKITSGVEHLHSPTAGNMEYNIEQSNLEPTPLIKNKLHMVVNDLKGRPTGSYSRAIEDFKNRYGDDLERATLLAEEVNQEITKLSDQEDGGLLGRKDDLLRGRELLRAAYIKSRSTGRNEVADIVKTARIKASDNRGGVAGQSVNRSLERMKGKKQMGSYWQEDPIIKNDGSPTDFGKLVAKIFIPNSAIRDTDRYLPTGDEKGYFLDPSFDEIEYACKAFALDCPFGSPEESWQTIFQNACQDRL